MPIRCFEELKLVVLATFGRKGSKKVGLSHVLSAKQVHFYISLVHFCAKSRYCGIITLQNASVIKRTPFWLFELCLFLFLWVCNIANGSYPLLCRLLLHVNTGCQSVKVSNSFSAEIAQVLQGLNTNKTKTLTCQSFLHFRNMSFFAFSWNWLFILMYPGIAMSGIITKKDDEKSDLFKN